MSSDDILWDADRHTLAKHAILKRYLQAWRPILSRQSARLSKETERILYVDGFAGPGEYRNGHGGSPLVAIDVMRGHSHEFAVEMRLVFIEARADRCEHLSRLLQTRQNEGGSAIRILDPICGDCEQEIGSVLERYDRQEKPFGPALVFLDQFGYSQVSMELIRRIMSHQVCEVLTFLNWRDMNRFISDDTKAAGIDRAFGGDDWRAAISLPPREREQMLLRCYKRALEERGGVDYSCHFAMHDVDDRLLYWLFFCSNNLEGLRQMKLAMWSVDETGEYRFSDGHDPRQLQLLEAYTEDWLARHLSATFSGQVVRLPDLNRYVLKETPCVHYSKALAELERSGGLEVVNAPVGRRRSTFKKYEKDPDFLIGFALTG